MKIKLLTQDPLFLAGVVHYGSLDQDDCSKYAKSIHIRVDDDDFKDEIKNIKINAMLEWV